MPDQEVFGLLGPNGAGKTTILMILCSILKPTSGTVLVNGVDVTNEAESVRRQLGIAFQEPALDSRLTVEQNLEFHADACRLERNEKKERVTEVLSYLDMFQSRKQKAGKLSGGMKKKLEDAKVFVQEPKIAVFDEPTAYLDVPSRHKVWKRISRLKDEGSTIILATNMMDEADRLCDRLGILGKGRLVATGTPSVLKDSIPIGDVIEIQVEGNTQLVAECLSKIPEVKQVTQLKPTSKFRVYVNRAELKLPMIMEALIQRGVKIQSVVVKEPSLDDVFLHCTGETL